MFYVYNCFTIACLTLSHNSNTDPTLPPSLSLSLLQLRVLNHYFESHHFFFFFVVLKFLPVGLFPFSFALSVPISCLSIFFSPKRFFFRSAYLFSAAILIVKQTSWNAKWKTKFCVGRGKKLTCYVSTYLVLVVGTILVVSLLVIPLVLLLEVMSRTGFKKQLRRMLKDN